MSSARHPVMAGAEPLGGGAAPAASSRLGRSALALALVAAMVLSAASAWRQGWFTPTAQVYVALDSANGVQIGTPVLLRGFKIGEVDQMSLERDLTVRVRLRLDGDSLPLLGSDASARLARDNPIAARHIELAPGRREGPRLAAGQSLPLQGGSELEDLVSTLKHTVEQLGRTLGRVDPILDDVRSLTGTAAAMRETLRAQVTETLDNARATSAQLRRTSEAARGLVEQLDGDRARLAGAAQGTLLQAQAAASSAGAVLNTLQSELPRALGSAQALLDNARDASADVKQMTNAVRGDVPPLVQSGRATAEDAADIAAGLKKTWPLTRLQPPPADGALPLDSHEGAR